MFREPEGCSKTRCEQMCLLPLAWCVAWSDEGGPQAPITPSENQWGEVGGVKKVSSRIAGVLGRALSLLCPLPIPAPGRELMELKPTGDVQ